MLAAFAAEERAQGDDGTADLDVGTRTVLYQFPPA
eukprot:COSAG02_NODE_34554_length_482_cov_0.819843_2_plen_34_part_01